MLRESRPISGCKRSSAPTIQTTGAELRRTASKQTSEESNCKPETFDCEESSPLRVGEAEPATGERCRIRRWRGAPRKLLVARPSAKSAVSGRGNRIRRSKAAAHPEFIRQKFHRAKLSRSLQLVAKARQRVQWERIPVQVVFQVENARKAGAGEFVFTPRAVVVRAG